MRLVVLLLFLLECHIPTYSMGIHSKIPKCLGMWWGSHTPIWGIYTYGKHEFECMGSLRQGDKGQERCELTHRAASPPLSDGMGLLRLRLHGPGQKSPTAHPLFPKPLPGESVHPHGGVFSKQLLGEPCLCSRVQGPQGAPAGGPAGVRHRVLARVAVLPVHLLRPDHLG